ncbi:MAG: ATP-binding protein [Bacteroidetes bacterium]|nr:ATP-binding protein [Bacteroidota bacterium]
MATLKVLVVDDEPAIRSGIDRILRNYSVEFPFMQEEFQFELIEAATGEEAINIINKDSMDIILLDNKLPGISGIEVLEYLNETKNEALVMMITSYASLDLAVKATKNGAYNFVPKPFTPTELKTAMENITKHLYLKRMTEKLNSQEKETRFQFLSVLSHELKSPINAIEGYLRMMQEKQVGDNIDDYFQMIDRSLLRIKGMRNLITDLLDLTKIESGQKNRNIQDIDITEIARFAMDTLEPMALRKSIKMFLDAPETISMKADKQEMEIIFNNLISNAIKYNKENGEVNILIKADKNGILIKVEDTGIGMSQDDISRLFHDFVRIKNTDTQNITGSGLGLSILKKLVNLYNGTIEVSSEHGKGSTFRIMIP